MTRSRRQLSVFAVLGAIAFALLFLLRREPALRPITLPDGTTVRVVSHSVRRQHYSPYETLPARATAFLPAGLRKLLPQSVQNRAAQPIYSTNTPTLAVWLEWDRTPPVAVTNSYPFTTNFYLFWGDDRSFLIRFNHRKSGLLPDGRYYEGYLFPPPPPVIPKVTATLYPRPIIDAGSPEPDTALGHWSWKNEAGPPTTNWIAEPLPQTRHLDGLDVTLKTLLMNVHRARKSGPPIAASDAADAWSFAQFDLRQQGQSVTNWRVERISSATDSVGNQQRESHAWTRGPDFTSWRWPQWPEQPWQFAVEFTKTSGFDSNELMTATGLKRGTMQTNTLESALGKLRLTRLQAVYGDPTKLELAIAFSTKRSPGRLTLVSVVDRNGENLNWSEQGFWRNPASFLLDCGPTNRVPLTVTLALQVGRIAEFRVQPRFLGTNSR